MPRDPGGQAYSKFQRESSGGPPGILHILLESAGAEIRARASRTFRVLAEDAEDCVRIAVIRIERIVHIPAEREVAGKCRPLIPLPCPAARKHQAGLDGVLAKNLCNVVGKRENGGRATDGSAGVIRKAGCGGDVTEA